MQQEEIDKNRELIKGDQKNLPWITSKSFTLAVDFELKKFDLLDQTILGVNCWALKIHKDDVLMWEKRETDQFWNTGFVVPLNERIILFLRVESKGKQ